MQTSYKPHGRLTPDGRERQEEEGETLVPLISRKHVDKLDTLVIPTIKVTQVAT